MNTSAPAHLALLTLLALLAAPACSKSDGDSPTPDAARPASDAARADASAPDAPGPQTDAGVDTSRSPDAGPPQTLAPFARTYPLAAEFPAPPGQQWRRAIVHLHSTHSHDACDGNPRPDGQYNLPCLASLRRALCTTRIDVAYLTDHGTHLHETPFEDLLLHDPATDRLVLDAGRPVANIMRCEDGFEVTLTVGMETSMMPLRFLSHVHEDIEERGRIVQGRDGATAQIMREHGALVAVAHTEDKSLETLRELAVDGLELYNLHANLDPRIRREHMGKTDITPLTEITQLATGRLSMHPDLGLLAFLEENEPALQKWAVLLEERPVFATAGTDAHENVFPRLARDGERFDSYRRMLSWFSNYVLAPNDSPQAFHQALQAGRLFVAFDLLASPQGFDAHIEADGGQRFEMGQTIPFAPGLTLRAKLPDLSTLAPSLEETPVTSARILRAQGASWVEVQRTEGLSVEHALTEPGVYRVEVRLTPRHLAPHLDPAMKRHAEREFPWIYTNAFRVLAPR